MAVTAPFRGIIPAILMPFKADESIDWPELRRYARWFTEQKGLGGLVVNGHAGEVGALTAEERAEVVRAVVAAVDGKLPIIAGICCEGVREAVAHAVAARDGGATGLLVMPHHTWLRFGMRPEHVVRYVTALGEAADINLSIHVYPSWTRASYSGELLASLARIPWVTTFKLGTRDISKYESDIRAIRQANPKVTVLTCHDECLLPTMVQGVDGALVGLAAFVPDIVVELFQAVCEDDLKRARSVYARLQVLKQLIYGGGQPTGDAHVRMKTATKLAGRISSDFVRAPLARPNAAETEEIAAALLEVGLLKDRAA